MAPLWLCPGGSRGNAGNQLTFRQCSQGTQKNSRHFQQNQLMNLFWTGTSGGPAPDTHHYSKVKQVCGWWAWTPVCAEDELLPTVKNWTVGVDAGSLFLLHNLDSSAWGRHYILKFGVNNATGEFLHVQIWIFKWVFWAKGQFLQLPQFYLIQEAQIGRRDG